MLPSGDESIDDGRSTPLVGPKCLVDEDPMPICLSISLSISLLYFHCMAILYSLATTLVY